ncbi:MAG: hypothetical protein M5U28_19940 [Sandaracinaceae bacterium]|nr:hypothetical protein [Sandaracinaceae bacterium]
MRAHVRSPAPAEISTTSVSPGTSRASVAGVVLIAPMPSCPRSFWPQQYTAPSS